LTRVGAFEAKTHFAKLLERVANGEEIMITKHGTPVARLIPVAGASHERIRVTIARLKEFCQGQTLGGVSIRELREEGRR
jgi:prevent-host-death family protein